MTPARDAGRDRAGVGAPGGGPPAATAPAVGAWRRLGERLWSAVVAMWAAITGLAPHVLHHVGPLAGAAVLSGAAGTALFGVVGFVATVPMLLRLRRRFRSWLAPAIALGVFVTVFTVSTVVVGPRLSGDASVDDQPPLADTDEHQEHH